MSFAGSGTPKAVTINAEPESISPLLEPIGEEEAGPFVAPHSPKQRRASMAKRLSGRLSITPTTVPQNSSSFTLPEPALSGSETQNDPHSRLVVQLLTWLSEEKTKRASHAPQTFWKEHATTSVFAKRQDVDAAVEGLSLNSAAELDHHDTSLQRLEQIISDSIDYAQKMASVSTADYQSLQTAFPRPRRPSSARKLRKPSGAGLSSDTEYQDGDALVPSTDVVLDNSKVLSYSGGEAGNDTEAVNSKRATKDKESWNSFKYEIVRLTHTLRLKGWRRVPLDQSSDISVQRLSGALTNAVYVVSPPSVLVGTPGDEVNGSSLPKKPPQKLLLRIYGPYVEHLIDRDSELQILRRLARKNIGPRLLGTFENGRFEEYFNATTLTSVDLRNPETSKQIAKRMRELHDGIELLPSERDAGPFVWQNWDKWVTRCEEIVTWLDGRISSHVGPVKSRSEAYKTRGFVCGVEWAGFRKAVDTYRKWLDERYGGKKGTRSQLVFAHNDTQYGNLLRIEPSSTSPLLLPANEHKQLVVIDFEYANANTPGLEFANHFTEWCYNYHSPTASYACTTSLYPTVAEQQRFIRAYLQHVPGYNIKSPAITPSSATNLNMSASSSSISAFMLDSRTPSSNYDAEEKARDEKLERELRRLIQETRLWRIANSVQWIAWGLVQAKVPGMDEALEEKRKTREKATETAKQKIQHLVRGKKIQEDGAVLQVNGDEGIIGEENEPVDTEIKAKGTANSQTIQGVDGGEVHIPHEHEIDDEPEFDYLAYAQDRAMFFWGDMLEFGLVDEADLPEIVRQRAKRVKH